MPTRTLPSAYPTVRTNEVKAGRLVRASTLRRIYQSQNYLWANLRRVYAMCACEGNGYILPNLPSSSPVQLGLENLPDGSQGKLISAFYVPRNWCSGTRLRIAYQAIVASTAVGTSGKVIAVVCRLDETPTGTWTAQTLTAAGTYDQTLSLRIPQDGEYQVKIYLQFTNGDPTYDVAYANAILINNISARYDVPDVQDLVGEPYTATKMWEKHYNPSDVVAYAAAASLLYMRLVENTNWIRNNRGPEVCQTYLGLPWNHTTSFVEVGRYVVARVNGVTNWAGRLFVHVQNGGAGCEVRVKLGGTVIQTWTALAAGDQTLTINNFAPGAANTNAVEDRTFTVEAKNLGGTTYWGTLVWGVSLWESTVDETGLPTIPTDYDPLDETGVQGDDPLVTLNDVATLPAGMEHALENDRWLYRNRLRVLIGDWRHKTYKRLATYGAYGTTFDPRVDWTRGEQWANQLQQAKNLTINGTTSGDNDIDSIGNHANGAGTPTGYTETPYTYPSAMTHFRHGRRLMLAQMAHVNKTPASELDASWSLKVRGKRVRPAVMSTDQNGFGPIPEEPPYRDKAYFELVYNGVTQTNPIRALRAVKEDHDHQWHLAARGFHSASSGVVLFTVRGRLPGQPSGAPPAVRPEGMLFEVELASAFLADEPLTQDALDILS